MFSFPLSHLTHLAPFAYVRLGLTLVLLVLSSPVWAEDSQPKDPPTLLGDMWGLRPFLKQHGITLTLQETSEGLGNVSGGIRQGFAYDGLTTLTLQLDTEQAFGHHGGTFNISGLQIHGRNLSADNLLSLQTASGIEARSTTRLWELWYQQAFMPGDKVDVRIGQQSIDQEFMTSQNSAYFINTMMGWPMLPSANMPGGGPAYPLSALGVRVRTHVTDEVTFLAGLYNGNPAPDNFGDPQIRNPHGLSFPLNGGVLAIAELQYTTPTKEGESETLPGIYKLGVWYDSERFHDIHHETLEHKGNYSFYLLMDQTVYRWADNHARNINLFARAMIAPQQDRNFIHFSFNGGVTFKGLLAERLNDTFGLGLGVTNVSHGVSERDRDVGFYNPCIYAPVRSHEIFIEATYQFQVNPWWQIQPDFQYVFRPGAGIANPYIPSQKVKNEAVLGMRTNVSF